ncbi:MAG: 3-oxoacyl-ACP synthase, partial [Planctomycetes bacterium]|nr:3-oxoacyl-ACP synthase [Planctomycetota bacterium]
MSQALPIRIRGTGSVVPEEVLTNEFFAAYLDTSAEWIVPRTGIHERRRVAADESVLTLALGASRKALESAGLGAEAIDLIMVCTAMPETPLPSTACWLQEALGVSGRGAAALDIA